MDKKAMDKTSRLSGITGWLKEYTTVVAITVVFLVFALFAPGFLTLSNLSSVLNQSAILMLVATGMSFTVVSGGTDLSVAATYGLGAMAAVLGLEAGLPAIVCVMLAILMGALFGLLNSFLIVKVKISIWLTTIGTLFIGESIERIVTKGGTAIYMTKVPEFYSYIGQGFLIRVGSFSLKFCVLLALAVALAAHFVLSRTIYGRHLYAAGAQYRAAELSGVAVKRNMTIAFVLSGICCCLAGVVSSSNMSSYIPLGGRYYLLDSMGAVFIGSTLNKRGFTNIPGMIVGVLFFGILSNGMNLMGLHYYWQSVARGAMIFAILAVDSYRRSKMV